MKKTKRNMLIAIFVSVAILTIGGARVLQIERNYQAHKPILEECISNYGTVIIEKKHFWSLSSATCKGS
ncbi:hypothetical protein BK130_08275 [Viridibacillus sp. FSL H8-0123]|nr:hypothetical protein BK130_08275 [Viridibacillus sp. FSL H8-0123]